VSEWTATEVPSALTPGALGPGAVPPVGRAALCLSASSGDVSPGRAAGVFSRDMRLVSHRELLIGCELLIGGEPAEPMGVVPAQPFSATFVGKLAVHG
jgi:hypothetical protein